jgi:hypothetical protein
MLSPTLLFRSKWAWRGVGFSDVRMWLEGLGALEYIGEDGENCYEASKFCHASGLMLSESLLDMAGTGDMGDNWPREQTENPEGERFTPVIAGFDQQDRPGLRGPSVFHGWGHPVLAANATDQGVTLHFPGQLSLAV